MEEVSVRIKRIDKHLPLPQYAYPGDAGVDLRCTEPVTLQPGERAVVPTGIALELPQGYAALVLPRSGLAARQGISVVNAPGLIDSNYRGVIKVILLNTDLQTTFHAERGERIAQLVVIRTEQVIFTETDDLCASTRGEGGFGSSGVS